VEYWIFIVVVGVVIFFVLREVMAWYIKTTLIADLLTQNQIIHKDSRGLLVKIQEDQAKHNAQSRALLVEIRDLLRVGVRTDIQIRNLIQGEVSPTGEIPQSDPPPAP
jgi:hypothetical protein